LFKEDNLTVKRGPNPGPHQSVYRSGFDEFENRNCSGF
jgi:hypothetical protein